MSARRVALTVVARVFDEDAYADRAFRAAAERLDQRDRAFAMQIAYGRASWWLAVSLLGVSVVYSAASGGVDAYSVGFGAGGWIIPSFAASERALCRSQNSA